MAIARRNSGTPGSRFALLMCILLVLLIVLVFSMRKHGSTQPNAGPPANQRLNP